MVSECSNKWRKEIQIIVYMWTKILYKEIKKSSFSLHQLVIKRKEKQNKRNVKHDDVSSISIEVIKTVFLYIYIFL